MYMYVENSTDDDATVKVSPGGPPGTVKAPPGRGVKQMIVKSKKIKRFSLTSPFPCVVEFIIEAGSCEVSSPDIKHLKLTRAAKNGFKIIMNGNN
jgi:hypothetical protein